MSRRNAQVVIDDDRQDQKYYAIVPHIVWVMARGPYDLMLWYVVKMIAGEQGECKLDTRDLARAAGMSIGKAADCRAYLIGCGLLDGAVDDDPARGHASWRLRIPDLWPRNVAWRAQVGDGLMTRIRAREEQHCSPHEQNCSPHEQNCSPGEQSQRSLHSVNNHKNNQDDNQKDDDARARENGSSSSFQTWDQLIDTFGQDEVTEAVKLAKTRGTDLRYVAGVLRNRAKQGKAPRARGGTGRRDPFAW